MTVALQSPMMTPMKTRTVRVKEWECRHCKHRWEVKDANAEPKQCPNRRCRAADWNREKIKEGRPRKPKGTAGRPRTKSRRK